MDVVELDVAAALVASVPLLELLSKACKRSANPRTEPLDVLFEAVVGSVVPAGSAAVDPDSAVVPAADGCPAWALSRMDCNSDANLESPVDDDVSAVVEVLDVAVAAVVLSLEPSEDSRPLAEDADPEAARWWWMWTGVAVVALIAEVLIAAS